MCFRKDSCASCVERGPRGQGEKQGGQAGDHGSGPGEREGACAGDGMEMGRDGGYEGAEGICRALDMSCGRKRR